MFESDLLNNNYLGSRKIYQDLRISGGVKSRLDVHQSLKIVPESFKYSILRRKALNL